MASFSKRLVASYVFDWLIIIIIAAAGGGLNFVTGYQRPFSLLDLTISYPYIQQELITTTTLVIVSLLAPALIIVIVVAGFVPGRRTIRFKPRSDIIRLKLWEFERGWAGLALSVATAFFITQGAKNLFGKPRPDLLARCQPDLSQLAAHVVGGYGQDISARWTLVDAGICTSMDKATLNDGFRSFPSGHSSFSWSGLLYLSLFLCSKFAITVPFLPYGSHLSPASCPLHSRDSQLLPLHQRGRQSTEEGSSAKPTDRGDAACTCNITAIRNRAATPPNYLIILAFVPIAVAFYICSTRFAQFYHHGFDIISGALIGILTAWFSFRWYHLPLGRGHGWAWGARNPRSAFYAGVGVPDYIASDI